MTDASIYLEYSAKYPLQLYWKEQDRTFSFPPHASTVTVGGDPSRCDILVRKTRDENFISRCHAKFVYNPSSHRWTVHDYYSRYGTTVNGIQIGPMDAYTLSEGDVVCLADRYTFVFLTTQDLS